MSKYNEDLKLKVVKYVLEQNHSCHQASLKFSVSKSRVEVWVRKYNCHGIVGLVKNSTKYTGDFKLNVLKYMHENHLSLIETSIKFNLSDTGAVSKWERLYYEEGPKALFEERRGRKNMSSKPIKNKLSKDVEEDLVDEIQRLRIENAYLKKLNALVQERIQRENPKKQKLSAN